MRQRLHEIYESWERDPYLNYYYAAAFLTAQASGWFTAWVMYG